MDSILKHIGSRLRQKRNEMGYSQEQMANSFGISRQQYQTYEQGNTDLSISRITFISNELDISIPELMGFIIEYPQIQGALSELLINAEHIKTVLREHKQRTTTSQYNADKHLMYKNKTADQP